MLIHTGIEGISMPCYCSSIFITQVINTPLAEDFHTPA